MPLIHVLSVGAVLSTRPVARTPRRKAASATNDLLSRGNQSEFRFF